MDISHEDLCISMPISCWILRLVRNV